VTLVGYASDPRRREREVLFDEQGRVKRQYDGEAVELQGEVKQGLSGEAVRILREPDLDKIREDLQALYDDGIRSLAIVFLHSYTYPGTCDSHAVPPFLFCVMLTAAPAHEQRVADIAREIGFPHVSLSSATMPMIKAVPRGTSSTADAYLTPVLQDYLDGFFVSCAPFTLNELSLMFYRAVSIRL
jgi:5-oxoprolinase (ATP-hydrolysing)